MKNPLTKMEILLIWLRSEFSERKWQRETWSGKIMLKRKTRYSPPGPKYDYWELFQAEQHPFSGERDVTGSVVRVYHHDRKPSDTVNLADPSCMKKLKRLTKKALKSVDRWYKSNA